MSARDRKNLSDGAIAACIACAIDAVDRAIQMTEQCDRLGIEPLVSLAELQANRDRLAAFENRL